MKSLYYMNEKLENRIYLVLNTNEQYTAGVDRIIKVQVNSS